MYFMEGHLIGSVERKEFESELFAWGWIHENFSGKQWYHDQEASKAAGYKIYRDVDEYYNYVCCLGDRLEVNLKEGNQTINLWIKSENDLRENYRTYEITKTELDTICDSLYLCVSAFASNDIQAKTFKNVDDIIYKLNLIKKLREGWETL
jgi:hypothetical protein